MVLGGLGVSGQATMSYGETRDRDPRAPRTRAAGDRHEQRGGRPHLHPGRRPGELLDAGQARRHAIWTARYLRADHRIPAATLRQPHQPWPGTRRDREGSSKRPFRSYLSILRGVWDDARFVVLTVPGPACRAVVRRVL